MRAADATIESLLKQAGTCPRGGRDGDYKIVIEWTRGKALAAGHIGGTPETFAGMPVYDVFAPALEVDEDGLAAEDANALLKASGNLKLGARELRGDGAFTTRSRCRRAN